LPLCVRESTVPAPAAFPTYDCRVSSTARRPPTPPLFPYTTLFRSRHRGHPARTVSDGHAARHGAHSVHDTARRDGGHRRVERYRDRKSTRLNSSHVSISYAVFCLKKKIVDKTDYKRAGSNDCRTHP